MIMKVVDGETDMYVLKQGLLYSLVTNKSDIEEVITKLGKLYSIVARRR